MSVEIHIARLWEKELGKKAGRCFNRQAVRPAANIASFGFIFDQVRNLQLLTMLLKGDIV
jgi:hypothetical protein